MSSLRGGLALSREGYRLPLSLPVAQHVFVQEGAMTRDEITPRGRVYWGGEWSEAEREEARRVDEEMGEQTVEEARACSRCGTAATWRLANGGEEIPFCWGCDERGAVDPIRAAWRRYNAAENSIRAAFDEDDQPTREELLERDLAKAGIEAAVRAEAMREREAEVERLREALLAYSRAMSEALSALSFVRVGGSPPPNTLRLLDAHLRSEAFVAAVRLVREL